MKLRAIIAASLLWFFASAAPAAEIRVLTSNGSVMAQREFAAEFTKATGHTVSFTAGPPGEVRKHIESSDAFDLIVMATASIEALEKTGKFIPGSRRALARTGIGLAVREGAPRPDLSTEESTRKALLAARSISYSFSDTGGTSGGNSQKALASLGIIDAVKAKLVPVQNDKGQAMIAAGEVEMGLYNLSEIGRARGTVRAGALPASVQFYSSYDVAVPATNAAPGPALAYRDFLLDPARRPRWESAGMEMGGKY